MKSKLLKGNLMILIATVAGFAIGYYLYLEVYTRNKEADIIATKSGILVQMSDNLERKVMLFKKNADWCIESFIKQYKDYKSLENKRFDPDNYIHKLVETSNSYLKVARLDKEALLDTAKKFTKEDVLMESDKNGLNFSDHNHIIKLSVSYSDLLSGIRKEQIFQEYILISDGNIVYSSLPGNPVLSPLNISESKENKQKDEAFNGGIEIIRKRENEFVIETAAIKGVSSNDVMISNKHYKILTSQLQLEDENWQLCGLVESSRINEAKRKISPGLLVIIFIILSLTILGLPFIQLKTISATEHLTQGAIINAAISVFLGACFVFIFIFFQSNVYWRKKQNEHQLKDFTKEIDEKFRGEIKEAWEQLEDFDTMGSFDQISENHKGSDTISGILTHNRVLKYKYFDYAFWMPVEGINKGKQVKRITPFQKLGEASMLIHRDYFNKADEWIYPHDTTQRFRMESLVSVSSGIPKSAISRLSERKDTSVKKDSVIAMTGQFHSIIETLVPAGFKFCIIDRSGKVWFHSERGRNLEENLLKVSKHNKYLQAALYAGASDVINLNYYDEPHRAFIQPVSPLPLYIVTLYDKQVDHSFQRQSLMLTLRLLTAMVIFIVIQFIVLFIIDFSIKKPGRKTMLSDFISMKSYNTGVYLIMSVCLFAASGLYLLFSDQKNVLNPLLFSLLALAYFFPYLNFAIKGFSFKSSNRNLFALVNILLILLINLSAIEILENTYYKLLIFQFLILLLMAFAYSLVKHKRAITQIKGNCLRHYLFFLCMILLLFGILPSIRNFEAAVNHELVVINKHAQFDLAQKYKERNIRLKDYYKPFPQDDLTFNLYQERIRKGIYTGFVAAKIKSAAGTNMRDDNNFSIADSLVNIFRPLNDRLSIETKYLKNHLLQGPYAWSWSRDGDSLSFCFVSNSEKYDFKESDILIIETEVRRPKLFNPWYTHAHNSEGRLFSGIFSERNYVVGIFFIIIIVILSGVFSLIRYSVRNFFGFPLIEKFNKTDFGDDLRNRIEKGTGLPALAVGSPFTSIGKYIKTKYESKSGAMISSESDLLSGLNDFKEIKKDRTLIIEDAFRDYKTPEIFGNQLKEINELISPQRKVLLTSTAPPHLIEEFFEQGMKRNTSDNEKERANVDNERFDQLLDTFRELMTKITIIFIPEKLIETDASECHPAKNCDDAITDFFRDKEKFYQCLICRELHPSDYLQSFHTDMKNFREKLEKEALSFRIMEDRIIQKIKEKASHYYDYLLSSCTSMEKFVLSDVADGCVVNIKNRTIINQLIKRGLLIIDDTHIRIMNESFRRYVRLKITKEEKEKLKKSFGEAEAGWQGYKLFLILALIGVIIFLFISSKDIFENLSQLFVVVGGGIALISKITGFVSRGSVG